MKQKQQAWSIKQLYNQMWEDLNNCHSDFEKGMIKCICEKEMREKATEFEKTRKLTPGEVSILQNIGGYYR